MNNHDVLEDKCCWLFIKFQPQIDNLNSNLMAQVLIVVLANRSKQMRSMQNGYFLDIMNVSGYDGCTFVSDLVSILSSVKCERLEIGDQSLWREETQALVQAMESGVKTVRLANEKTLDIETLTEYSGQGVCRVIDLFVGHWCSTLNLAATRYGEELRTWAEKKNWGVTTSDDGIKVEGTWVGPKCSKRTLSKKSSKPKKHSH